MKKAAFLFGFALMPACAALPTDGMARSHYYLGLVRVAYPASRGKLTVVDVKSLGLGFDGAAFFGWRDSKFVYAQPEDCRAIIILRDRIEESHVARLVEALGDKACVADYTRSLSPR